MPTYDFRCELCGLVKEATMSFKDSEEGIQCECDGTMVRQFTPCVNLQCAWKVPYKPGHNAREDRKRAFLGLADKKKLPKSVTPENSNFSDLM